MANVISSLRPFQSFPMVLSRPLSSNRPHLGTPAAATSQAAAAVPASAASPAPKTGSSAPTANAAAAANSSIPDFRTLFMGNASQGAPEPVKTQAPAPTAESVFGPSPWVTNPTGIGPNGVYSMNPFYFATPQTAAKVAEMVGGTVVQSSQFTPNGGPFLQQQANQMVQLADGRLINPGLVASYYNHGFPQSYVDSLVANEVRNS
jgi:hypothetical protein